MKQFHVYGIGNALVDLDFEVSDATLERLNIAKGLMTLIDETRHHELLDDLEGMKHVKTCGGSLANTLITMQQLGAKTFYSCRVASDAAGDFFYQDLLANGIATNLTHDNRKPGHTGKCIVMVTPDADRTMSTFLGATAQFSHDELHESALKNSEYLYIEGYLVASDTARAAAITAREWANKHGVKTALSLSDPNMVMYFKKGLQDIMGKKIDLLFCNEQEAKLFTETESITAAEQALKTIARAFVITRGEHGATVFDGNKTFPISAVPTKVVDTVGAGDVFSGAFLYGITHDYSFSEAGKLATLAASRVVAKIGPRLSHSESKEVHGMISCTES